MIKAIVLDMDGTLLNDNDAISPRTKDRLIKAQEQGIRIIFASGRTIYRMISHAKDLEMDKHGGYLVYVNGTGIYDLAKDEDRRLYEMSIENQIEVFEYFKDKGVELVSVRDDGAMSYIPRDLLLEKMQAAIELDLDPSVPLITDGHQSIGRMKEKGYVHLSIGIDADSYINTCNKMAVFAPSDILIPLTKDASDAFDGKYWIGRTMPCWSEIMLPTVNKAMTLSKLFNELDINPQDTIAFGDGENDIEMLKLCGIGVAMGNSLDLVKLEADQICATNNEDGIADVLDQFL